MLFRNNWRYTQNITNIELTRTTTTDMITWTGKKPMWPQPHTENYMYCTGYCMRQSWRMNKRCNINSLQNRSAVSHVRPLYATTVYSFLPWVLINTHRMTSPSASESVTCMWEGSGCSRSWQMLSWLLLLSDRVPTPLEVAPIFVWGHCVSWAFLATQEGCQLVSKSPSNCCHCRFFLNLST